MFEAQCLAEFSLLIPSFKGGNDLCLFTLLEWSAEVSRILLISQVVAFFKVSCCSETLYVCLDVGIFIHCTGYWMFPVNLEIHILRCSLIISLISFPLFFFLELLLFEY